MENNTNYLIINNPELFEAKIEVLKIYIEKGLSNMALDTLNDIEEMIK